MEQRGSTKPKVGYLVGKKTNKIDRGRRRGEIKERARRKHISHAKEDITTDAADLKNNILQNL